MADFSPANYDLLLRAIKLHGYDCITFNNKEVMNNASPKLIALRHDVDVSMDFALKMAEQEAKLGVHSTYFVMLRSPMYNLMSRHSSMTLRKIVELGHEVALHFDAAFIQGAERTIEQWILFEVGVLRMLINAPVNAFSFHQPTREIIGKKIEIEGLINTYHPDHLNGFQYLSDSNRIWQNKSPFALMESGVEKIHLLLHPVWWMCEHEKVEDCWDEVIRQNFGRTQQQLLATERAYGDARDIQLKR